MQLLNAIVSVVWVSNFHHQKQCSLIRPYIVILPRQLWICTWWSDRCYSFSLVITAVVIDWEVGDFIARSDVFISSLIENVRPKGRIKYILKALSDGCSGSVREHSNIISLCFGKLNIIWLSHTRGWPPSSGAWYNEPQLLLRCGGNSGSAPVISYHTRPRRTENLFHNKKVPYGTQ